MTVRDIKATWPSCTAPSLARADQPGHRRRPGRGARVADRPLQPSTGGVFRRAAGQDPRRGPRQNKAVYLALALNPDGDKDVLGLWIEQTEGAKFWLKVVNESKPAASTTSSSPWSTGSRASPRPSRPCFRRPRCRPASSTSSATAWPSCPGGPQGDPARDQAIYRAGPPTWRSCGSRSTDGARYPAIERPPTLSEFA